MDKNRILELAIETLEKKKAEIESEIEILRSEIKGLKTIPIRKKTSAKPAGKGKKSAAERKAQSEKMKQIWAERKSKAKKGKAKAPKAKPAQPETGAKARQKTAAEKKALSLKMKEVWKKRKAQVATQEQSK